MDLKDVNSAVNILAFLLIVFGGVIALHNAEVGKEIIIGGLGAFGGGVAHKSTQP
jgi:hypothetical protein